MLVQLNCSELHAEVAFFELPLLVYLNFVELFPLALPSLMHLNCPIYYACISLMNKTELPELFFVIF
jgi:hypothetical protein